MQTFHIKCDFCELAIETERAIDLPAKWRRFFVISNDRATDLHATDSLYFDRMHSTKVETMLDVCNHCLGKSRLIDDPKAVEEHAVVRSWFHRLTVGHLNFFNKAPKEKT